MQLTGVNELKEQQVCFHESGVKTKNGLPTLFVVGHGRRAGLTQRCQQ